MPITAEIRNDVIPNTRVILESLSVVQLVQELLIRRNFKISLLIFVPIVVRTIPVDCFSDYNFLTQCVCPYSGFSETSIRPQLSTGLHSLTIRTGRPESKVSNTIKFLKCL